MLLLLWHVFSEDWKSPRNRGQNHRCVHDAIIVSSASEAPSRITHRDNFVTPFEAVTPYSIRFFHPELAFPFPHLDDFQSFPLTFKYVMLLVEMKKPGVLFPSVLSCGNMMVNASFDISTFGLEKRYF